MKRIVRGSFIALFGLAVCGGLALADGSGAGSGAGSGSDTSGAGSGSDSTAKVGDKHPCAPDRAKFCKTVKAGNGRIKACLKKHDADLSDKCKAVIDKVAE